MKLDQDEKLRGVVGVCLAAGLGCAAVGVFLILSLGWVLHTERAFEAELAAARREGAAHARLCDERHEACINSAVDTEAQLAKVGRTLVKLDNAQKLNAIDLADLKDALPEEHALGSFSGDVCEELPPVKGTRCTAPAFEPLDHANFCARCESFWWGRVDAHVCAPAMRADTGTFTIPAGWLIPGVVLKLEFEYNLASDPAVALVQVTSPVFGPLLWASARVRAEPARIGPPIH